MISIVEQTQQPNVHFDS